MIDTTMSSSTSCFFPATEALEKSLKLPQLPIVNNGMKKKKSSKMINYNKRSLSDMSSFDMGSLFEASVPVEESISFPTIEWSIDSDDEEDNEFLSSPPSAKRRCIGLTRSDGVGSELSSLASLQRLDSQSSLW